MPEVCLVDDECHFFAGDRFGCTISDLVQTPRFYGGAYARSSSRAGACGCGAHAGTRAIPWRAAAATPSLPDRYPNRDEIGRILEA